MWDDQRVQAAIAGLPPEAFLDGPPADGELTWRRALKRLAVERGLGPPVTAEPGHLAPVVELRPRPPAGGSGR